MHEELYIKTLTMKAWAGRMIGYGKHSKTCRSLGVWNLIESRNVTLLEALPGKLCTFDHDHNDGDDGNFLDLESSSVSLGAQEMTETEADAEPDTGDSRSDGTTSNVHEECDSDVDEKRDSDVHSGTCEEHESKRIAHQLRQLGDFNNGPASANVAAIYLSALGNAYIVGHPLLDTPNTCKVSSTPRKHKAAMASAQALEWQTSMERKVASMSKHDVYCWFPH